MFESTHVSRIFFTYIGDPDLMWGSYEKAFLRKVLM